MARTVEIFTGAYTSGKSEISVNRALMLSKENKEITLIDLDTVEPAYTLRPIKKELEELGIKVITQESYFGLGETGSIVTTEQMNCLINNKNDLVIDVGYGVGGLDILEVVTDISKEENLNINIVINTCKYETATVDSIVEYIDWSKGEEPQDWKKFTGIISNTHLGDETTREDVIRGYEITQKASEKLGIPIKAICISEKISSEFEAPVYDGIPIWVLTRYMPKAFW